jgi:hypothetical protein
MPQSNLQPSRPKAYLAISSGGSGSPPPSST